MPPLKIAIVGTGNVGFHLAKKFAEASSNLVAIVSRQQTKSRQLIDTLGLNARALTIDEIEGLHVDLVILAVPDGSIEQVISNAHFPPETTIVHTSGSQPMCLLNRSEMYGVLYPFQTFTKTKQIDFDKIPIFIEGSDSRTIEVIRNAALMLNTDIRVVSSEERLRLHLAAVFACNFTNHLYAIAENILSNTGGNLSDLNHLMRETVDKAVELSAHASQTGPAVRGDHEVISKHLDLLKGNASAEQVYQLITDQIRNKHS